MSDESKRPNQDDELDNVSGGMLTHPLPHDPIRPQPPTHPSVPVLDPIEPHRQPTNPG